MASEPLETSGVHQTTEQLYTEIQEVYVRGTGWQPAPEPAKASGRDGDIFVAHHRHAPTGNELENSTWVDIRNEPMLAFLKKHFPLYTSLYDRNPGSVRKMDSRDLYLSASTLRDGLQDETDSTIGKDMNILLGYVKARFVKIKEKFNELPASTIIWPLLWLIISNGSKIESPHDLCDTATQAFVVDSWQYSMDDRGRAFLVKGHHYQWSGVTYQKIRVTKKIPEFRDIRTIDSLEFWPLRTEREVLLHDRGQTLAEKVQLLLQAAQSWPLMTIQYATKVYSDYTGSFYTRMHIGASRLPGTGKVMLDVLGFRKFNPILDVWADDTQDESIKAQSQGETSSVPFDSALYCLLPPVIHGFSFKYKRWGEFAIDQLHSVEWSHKAFDHLVIPDPYRRAIRSLVDVHTGKLRSYLFADLVEGKGEGLILAFHGRAGTGKTLTAEAISEHLRRPLYVVGAGELGITVQALEKKLAEVLELAASWKAVLLIDEADIFLEKRATGDIERNALVGVFLRKSVPLIDTFGLVLEYYSGVLILTTNRLGQFDEAFRSRFSLTLTFHNLDTSSRQSLWHKFIAMCRPELQSAEVEEEFNLSELAQHPLNGRSIKQVTRTAQAMALCDNQQLTLQHVREVLSLDQHTDD